ncbi:hypothetical protein RHEC894_CH01518 [Rhizobium sp. CIAT894]|uniref:DUF982 domain-containing protein n=1 Tax=Rhizobium sp. CIAT894 TaxID=2020312 RepID=UPI000190966A|nr:DUF982 domain-containing protein [Rhizobium sp. CIAT894]ARM87849.1 hypothetical protein RHEC894_CH01518 [Rhizobium sp. CIAT894]
MIVSTVWEAVEYFKPWRSSQGILSSRRRCLDALDGCAARAAGFFITAAKTAGLLLWD